MFRKKIPATSGRLLGIYERDRQIAVYLKPLLSGLKKGNGGSVRRHQRHLADCRAFTRERLPTSGLSKPPLSGLKKGSQGSVRRHQRHLADYRAFMRENRQLAVC